MKKLLAAAGAVALASCAAGSPAYAFDNDNTPRYEQRHDNGKHRGHYKRDRHDDRRWNDTRYYNHDWDRRYRGPSYWHWRYFYRYPSYYQGYPCPRYSHVIVRDPYTLRYVCMPRYDYERYRIELRIRL